MPWTAEVFPDWEGTLLPGNCRAVSIYPLSQCLHGLANVPCPGASSLTTYEVDNISRVTRVCTMCLVCGVLTCDDGVSVDDLAHLAAVAVAGLCGVVVVVLL